MSNIWSNFLFETYAILKRLPLTSIPVSGPMCVDSLCSAMSHTLNVFVFRAVRPSEHFGGRSEIWGLSHLLVSVVPSRVALGWVFESLKTQICKVIVILLVIHNSILKIMIYNYETYDAQFIYVGNFQKEWDTFKYTDLFWDELQ